MYFNDRKQVDSQGKRVGAQKFFADREPFGKIPGETRLSGQVTEW